RDEIPLGFRVDNIRWARDGSILAAGQGTGETVVVKINPRTLEVKEVLRRPGQNGFNGGTVAVEAGGSYWIGSFAGDRIAVLPARRTLRDDLHGRTPRGDLLALRIGGGHGHLAVVTARRKIAERQRELQRHGFGAPLELGGDSQRCGLERLCITSI